MKTERTRSAQTPEPGEERAVFVVAPGGLRDPCGIGRLVGKESGKGLFLDGLEGFGVAEKPGDPDQQVAKEPFHFYRCLLHEFHIALQGLDLVDGHAPFDAAVDGAGFVLGEIVTGLGAQQDEDLLQGIFFGQYRCGNDGWMFAKGMGDIRFELADHVCRR